VNFDDFRLYAERPRFKDQPKTDAPAVNPVDAALKADQVKNAGLSPQQAVREMTFPEGFSATVFAAEPDVRQPIALCLDDRGRVWIAEAYGYPFRQPEGQGKDRILCFEDTDGDGAFDRRTVFLEGLNLVSGMEYGFGGLWVGAAPYLYFIPIEEGDAPRPAGEPRAILEGFAWQDTHETLNSFRWGPDGWLYGCHGVFTHSHVKKAGAPDNTRQFINAGIFRVHPVTHDFEVFAEGTSNPWGIDFNATGHAFIEACVIPHFWHIIQGGRYQRQAGQHYLPSRMDIERLDPDYWRQDFAAKTRQPVHPHVYEDLKTHGDHVHWLGSRPHAGNSKSDEVGGGHAHAGLLIYQGDSWPAEFRGKAFMGNIHGQRINMDIPVRKGSGYIGKHGADFLNFNDLWSQALNFRTDQNGSVYVIDWYDQNQCHRRDEKVHDRSNGRVYKIIYKQEAWTAVDFASRTDGELISLLSGSNEMPARHARRLLQERAAAGRLAATTREVLRKHMGFGKEDVSYKIFTTLVGRLRLLWTLHGTGGVAEADILNLLRDESEYLRAWMVQLSCESGAPSAAVRSELARMAKEDASPHVRLYLASALQRMPVGDRLPILTGLLAHAGDADDHNLPLMYWYAAEPVVGGDRVAAVRLLAATKIPQVRQFIARRMASK
jgi:putative membrane-bound dehydrogenase-like protein